MKYSQEIENAYKAEMPFVAFKNPNEKLVNVIIQNSKELIEFNDFTKSGYVFAPFDSEEKSYLINPDIYFVDNIKRIDIKESFKNDKISELDKKNHIDIVNKAIKTLSKTSLSKVVISRKEEITVDNFNFISVYNKLINLYPNAYVYVWFHPKVGMWMGATPETLLKVNKNTFKTMALAGTQPFNGDLNPEWGSKELEEQQMVSDYIKQHLKGVVDSLTFSKVETVKAGSLLHLKTNVTGELRNSKDVASLVKLLHPTPAVCGLPKELSKQFILQNENYHRSFYSGYLGILNMNRDTSFFVNLRCFQVIENKVILYVGGGITAYSDAYKEWEETVAKSKIIKTVL